MSTKDAPADVQVVRVKRKIVKVTVEGIAPLLVNAVPEHLLEDIWRKQHGLPPIEREVSPEDEYESSIYRLSNGEPCFPSRGFKKGMVRAGKYVDGVAMIDVSVAVHVLGDMCPLRAEFAPYRDKERNIRNQLVPVIYPRADEWEADLTVLYVTKIFSEDGVINLLYNAGLLAGVGRRRPELGGQFGMYDIKEVQVTQ